MTDDLLIIALSAHGIASTTAECYLVPSDIGSIAPALDTQRAISTEELAAWMSPIQAGTIALVIDACHSAAAIERDGFRPGPMGNRDFGQLAYDKGMLILAASQLAETAEEGRVVKRGLLSSAITTEGLQDGLADWRPRDGAIDLREWLAYGVERVPGLALKWGVPKPQQPVLFDFVRRSVRRSPRISDVSKRR